MDRGVLERADDRELNDLKGSKVADTASRPRRVRALYFMGTAIAGYIVALIAITVGVLLDLQQAPFGAWSLVMILLGSFVAAGAGQLGAIFYRMARRNMTHRSD